MKAIKITVLIFLLAVSARSEGWMASLNYNVAIPGQEMKPQINNPSLLGFSLDARKFIAPQFAVGASLGNQIFYCKSQTSTSIRQFFWRLAISLSQHHSTDADIALLFQFRQIV